MLNALSVDVEDYYHVSAFESVVRLEDWGSRESRVERNTYRVLDLFDEYQVKGTFFVLGWVAERNPALVRVISQRGHEIASHGYAHELIYRQTPEQFRAETRRAKRAVEDVTGEPVLGYRAASYSITDKSFWALDILAEEGFAYDSSIFPIRHDRYGIPHHTRFFHFLNETGHQRIAEVPLSTVRFAGINFPIAGGGYFRVLPYFLTHLALRYLNRQEGEPGVFYFHPWEIDPDQPRISAGWLSRFRHYTNLRRMEAKLQKLLSNFSFAPIREVYAIGSGVSSHSVKSDAA
ncbi:MAG TPA: XrtA system polysaccharide deacetylase [Candidatus Binatia bacterium]|jgi:polysaccharide deacetylase family protein (PEP-CTERM system associated)